MKYNLDEKRIPKHIGIIMDGNGRYAQRRGLPRTMGHKEGAETLRRLSEFAAHLGVKYLTVYAFSTENWKRPQDEVSGIMKLLGWYLGDWEKYLGGKDVRIVVIGDISEFDKKLQEKIRFVEEKTKDRTGMVIQIALGYGGRAEIVRAAKQIALLCKDGTLSPDQIDEELFSRYLYTAGVPDPELIIRPGGEMRLSNFLTWQSTYSELYVTDILWPEFTDDDLVEAIWVYQQRQRRFGGVTPVE